jgi:hypothetical protein
MSDNRIIEPSFEKADYNSLVASINFEYCKKHDYDFIYYRPYLADKDSNTIYNCVDPHTNALRHASWSKLLSTYLVLKKDYDYVCYIDSDCIFYDFNKPLNYYIDTFKVNDLIFLNNKPWNNDKPCAGFYIAKVCSKTKNFVKDWYHYNLQQKNTKHPWEQDALMEIFYYYNLVLVDDWMFREVKGQYLRHISAGSEPHINRSVFFRKFIDDNKIDYSNVNDITFIEFDTSPNCFHWDIA